MQQFMPVSTGKYYIGTGDRKEMLRQVKTSDYENSEGKIQSKNIIEYFYPKTPFLIDNLLELLKTVNTETYEFENWDNFIVFNVSD